MQLITKEALDAVNPPDPSPDLIDYHQLAESTSSPSLRMYAVITEFADRFIQKGWSPEAVFWSRYFWFWQVKTLHHALQGFDAGNEQWAFKMLEHPFPDCDPDWSNLEQIESLAESDANAVLAERAAKQT